MKELLEKQQKLDNIIFDNVSKRAGLKASQKSFISQEFLACFVEFGEFIEEKEYEKKKTELIDALHFLLSIGNFYEVSAKLFNDFNTIYMHIEKEDIIWAKDKFLIDLSRLCNASRCFKYWSINRIPRNVAKNYVRAIISLLTVAKAMGYEADEVKIAYHQKFLENIERQQNNY